MTSGIAHAAILFFLCFFVANLSFTALNQCGGNQSRPAKLLHLKSTTFNAKMKHYGLSHVRSMMFQSQKATQTK